jgi:cysteinyl-tRNA synthetase
MDTVLGLKMDEMKEEAFVPDDEVQALLDARKAARAAKDWAKSDEIRDALKAKGLTVKDLPDGSVEVKRI